MQIKTFCCLLLIIIGSINLSNAQNKIIIEFQIEDEIITNQDKLDSDYTRKELFSNHKILIEAPTAGKGATCISCAHCPWMAMNSLKKLLYILETGENEIFVEKNMINKAKGSIEKLLNFTSNNRQVGLANDA